MGRTVPARARAARITSEREVGVSGSGMARPCRGMSVGAETAFNRQIWPADGRWLAAIRAELRGWLAAFALSDELEDDVVLP